MQPEKLIVNKIKDWLSVNCSGFYFKVHGGPYQRSGLPDIMGCWNGRFIGIEVKQPGGKPTELQQRTINDINRAGGLAFVACSVEDVSNEIKKLSKESNNSRR
jgi:hypothetical protein